MPKNHDIKIRLSEEELQKIKTKSKELGMSISSFMRFISLKAKVEVTN